MVHLAAACANISTLALKTFWQRQLTDILPASPRQLTHILPALPRQLTDKLPALPRQLTGILPASPRKLTDIYLLASPHQISHPYVTQHTFKPAHQHLTHTYLVPYTRTVVLFHKTCQSHIVVLYLTCAVPGSLHHSLAPTSSVDVGTRLVGRRAFHVEKAPSCGCPNMALGQGFFPRQANPSYGCRKPAPEGRGFSSSTHPPPHCSLLLIAYASPHCTLLLIAYTPPHCTLLLIDYTLPHSTLLLIA